MTGKRKAYLLMASVLAVSQLTSCGLLPKEEEFNMAPIIKEYEGVEYSKVNVKSGDVVEAEKIECVYSASEREELAFTEEELEINKVYVKQGDKVKKGDILADLKNEGLEEEISIKDFEIKKNKLLQRQKMEMRDLEVQKQKKVYNDANAIKAIQEQYRVEISNLKNELELLILYRDDLLEQKMSYSLVAGINGNVTYVAENVEGKEATYGELICVVAEKSKPRFIAETKRASDFKDGEKVMVTVGEEEFLTTVSHPAKKKNVVYFDLMETPKELENDERGNVQYVIRESRDVLYLPKSCVKAMGDKHVVYYEDENGLKVAKEVEVGLTAESKTEIISGVELGDEIIVK